MIDRKGQSVRPNEAFKSGIIPDIIFIRSDGWVLGAPAELENVAYEMWEENWIGFIRNPNIHIKPIEDYEKESEEDS